MLAHFIFNFPTTIIFIQKGSMYGCVTPCLIYGWHEDEKDTAIDPDWIDEEEHFELFWEELIRFAGFNPMYGIECGIDESTGIPHVSDDEKRMLKKAFKRYKKSKAERNIEVKGKLGYFLAVQTDIGPQCELYTLPKPKAKKISPADESS